MPILQHSMSRTLIALLVVGSLLGNSAWAKDNLIGQDDVPYGAASDYLIGRQLLKEGQFAEALGYLHLVYRTHPDVPTIALDFQEALVAEGYFKDAMGVMDRLIAANPDSVSYLLQRANLNIHLGNEDEALTDLRQYRKKGGSSPDVIIAEANLLASQGNLNQALDVYRDGIQIFPEMGAQLYTGMAILLQRNGKVEDIPDLLEEALDNYPDSPELWLLRVRSLAMVGKHSQALESARQADSLFRGGTDPELGTDPEGDLLETPPAGHSGTVMAPDSYLVELADFYVQQSQVERAVGILKPLSDADELDLTPSLWLARIYLGTGQLDPGRQLVKKIVTTWPESGRGWFLKGKLREKDEDWTGAIPLFEKASSLAPHDPEIRLAYLRALLVGWEADLSARSPDADQQEKRAHVEQVAVIALTLIPAEDAEGQLVLGYAFRTLEDPWRAETCFELAAANPELRIPAETQRSLCFDEIGEPVKARQVLEKLQSEYPRHPEVANSLGYFLAEKGEDLEKAVLLIQIALDDQPGNGAFLDSMGWALYRQGRTEAAFDYLIQAVNVLPDDPVILEHLGMVLLELGQSKEAEGMLKRALALGGDELRLEAVLADISGNQNGEIPDHLDSEQQ